MTLRFWNKDVESVRYHHFFLASILAFMSPVYADDAVPVTSAQTEAVATKAQEPLILILGRSLIAQYLSLMTLWITMPCVQLPRVTAM